MHLKPYLDTMLACSENDLPKECGVSDNFIILLDANRNQVIKLIQKSGDYAIHKDPVDEFLRDYLEDSKRHTLFFHKYNSINLVIREVDNLLVTDGMALDYEICDEVQKLHAKFQIDHYHTCIRFHTSKSIEPTEIASNTELAEAIYDICTLAVANRIALCLPESIGWSHLREPNRYDRVSYYGSHPKIKIPA